MLELLAMLCFGAAWLISNHYVPWTSFYSEAFMLVGLGLLGVALGKTWWKGKLPAVVWGIVLIAAIPPLQWVAGLIPFSGDAWISSLYLLSLACAIAVGYLWSSRDAEQAARRLAATVLAGGLISAVIALTQSLLIEVSAFWIMDTVPGMRSHANLGQPNNLALLLGLASVSLILLYEQRRVGAPTAWLILLMLTIGAATTQSRTALFFGPIIAIGMLVLRRRAPLRTGVVPVLAASIVHLGMTWAWPKLQASMLLSGVDNLGDRAVVSLRFKVWPVLIDALNNAPWTGYGWLQVGTAEVAAADRHPPVGELWLHGHNLVLELLLWCGYPLGILLCLGLVFWGVTRILKVRSVEGVTGLLALALFIGHAMLELPQHYIYFLVPAGLWVGQVEWSAQAPRVTRARWGLAVFALWAGLAVSIARDYSAVEEDFRLMRFEVLSIGTLRATQPAPDAPMLSQLTAYLRMARLDPVRGMSTQELASMRTVAHRFPYFRTLWRYGLALALNGQQQEARHVFVLIEHIHGPKKYAAAKLALHERVVDLGEAELVDLEKIIP